MIDVMWWPNWYCKRLHAVVNPKPDAFDHRAVCAGAHVRMPTELASPWQQKKIAAGIPRCATCEKLVNHFTNAGAGAAE